MEQGIRYEHPLNERVRTMLRLDHLFQQFDHGVAGESTWHSRIALASLFDLLELVSRNELRTETVKELERHSTVFGRLQQTPGVDASALQSVQDEIQRVLEQVQQFSNLILESFRQHEFLNAIRQRSSIPGGTCAFDLPNLHDWLSRIPANQRCTDLRSWIVPLQPLKDAIRLILDLIRGSAVPHRQIALAGFFQQNLDSSATPIQLVRIIIPSEQAVFPEVSGSQHRFSIRFLAAEETDRKTRKTDQAIEFLLACCAI